MAVVYKHLRADTGSPFYVGIGKTNKRAYEIGKRRTAHWNRIVKKYGYTVDIICEGISWEEACKIEQYLIGFYGRKDLGKGGLINLTDGGEGVPGRKGAMKGKKQSEETIAKRSAALTGIPRSEETKAKISAALTGIPRSEETKAKLRAANKGKKQSEETIAKRVAKNTGKKQSEETIAKRSAAMTGRKQSEETKAKQTAALKAYWAKKKNACNSI